MKSFFLFILLIPAAAFAQQAPQWPHNIPARIHDGANADVFVMTLGNVAPSIADGEYDPSSDEFRLTDGRVIPHYYRDSLHIQYFRPIDKSVFAVPPSGWCSWYYYYQDVSENEVERNAEWIANNLKDYGAVYVQIDDGWQGIGHGMGENRDWTTIDKRFSGGMDKLAATIKKLGLKPGIWLAPHGQSNPVIMRNNPGVFFLKKNDSTASNTWEGTYLVDPSTDAATGYLKNLFSTLTSWGYEYFKIDGQPIVVTEYREKRSFMRDTSQGSVPLYRKTLLSIREGIGPNRYLLGCWGIPVEGAGIMNGSRTGGDVVLGWSGFEEALRTTMHYYYLHDVLWYCDPDVMLLRSPLTLHQARAWATLQGLTGQALMSSDRLPDLSAERVDILRRIFPAVDIRPLDLFPSQSDKRVWDLKINHLGSTYDVVGVFNFDEEKNGFVHVKWGDLGIEDAGPVHVFDFWNKEYLGAWDKGIMLELPPTSCRVLTLLPDSGRIQLISTSRHITQGWLDLVEVGFDQKTRSYSGKSRVIRGDPYEIRFAFPRGKNFRIKNASAAKLPVEISNHQGWATLRFTSPKTTEVSWGAEFEPSESYTYQPQKPDNLSYEPVGLDGIRLRWESQYYLNAGYQVYLNGNLSGYTPANSFEIAGLNPLNEYNVSVKSVWLDGNESKEKSEVHVRLVSEILEEMYLSELPPRAASADWGRVRMNRSVLGRPLQIGGRQFRSGIGTHANSDIDYNLHGLFDSLFTYVGIDDSNGSSLGSAEFTILGDGKVLWKSGIMKKGSMREARVNIGTVRTLLLRVTDAGDGIDYDHADWANAIIQRRKK